MFLIIKYIESKSDYKWEYVLVNKKKISSQINLKDVKLNLKIIK